MSTDQVEVEQRSTAEEMAEQPGAGTNTNGLTSESFKKPLPKTVAARKPSQDSTETDEKSTTEGKSAPNSTGPNATGRPSRPAPVLDYKTPDWSGPVEQAYSMEVLKDGRILETIALDRPVIVIGSVESCDVRLAHPSISRYHAVFQYCPGGNDRYEKGWYLYDLGSTNGTKANKVPLKPRRYERIRVDYVLKFGLSTRLYVVQGPDEDRDEESQFTVTELMEKRREKEEKLRALERAEDGGNADADKDGSAGGQQDGAGASDGCQWGFFDDVPEDVDLMNNENPFELTNLTLKDIPDPKKTLKGFFDREGLGMPDFEVTEVGFGEHRVRFELPIDPTGRTLPVEVTCKGKRRFAIVECALEACRLLDGRGMLRASAPQLRKRTSGNSKELESNDFYDSDEDTFFDRTGDLEKKRQKRMERAHAVPQPQEKVHTYESLTKDLEEAEKELSEIQTKLDAARQDAKKRKAEAQGEVDALELYMQSLQEGAIDTVTKMKLKRRSVELKRHIDQLKRLMKIAEPVKSQSAIGNRLSGALSSVGKRLQLPKLQVERNLPEAFEGDDENDEEPPVTNVDTSTDKTVMKDDELAEKQKDSSPEKSQQNVDQTQPSQSSSSPSPSPSPSPSSSASSARRKGPTIPADLEDQLTSAAAVDGPTKPADEEQDGAYFDAKPTPNPKLRPFKPTIVYETTDENYVTWVPPKNQTGDGRTRLNEKYGY